MTSNKQSSLRLHIFSDLDSITILRNLDVEPGFLDTADVGGDGDRLSCLARDDIGCSFALSFSQGLSAVVFRILCPTAGDDELRKIFRFRCGRLVGELWIGL